jgi:hypothetical protein
MTGDGVCLAILYVAIVAFLVWWVHYLFGVGSLGGTVITAVQIITPIFLFSIVVYVVLDRLI